jgi:hypothetical protein|nr:MAG TPA: hypothetical protein [Caudoviricetes sp.]
MIRVRTYETTMIAKRAFIEYCEHNAENIKVTKLRGLWKYVPLVVLKNNNIILFMSYLTYDKWCKGRTYYDDFEQCYKRSGYKISNELAEKEL